MTTQRRQNVDDWHDRLISAAQARHTSAVRNNNRNQNSWKDAVSHLERSRAKIYIPKTGQHAGMVLGIPAAINATIVQTLSKIVLGEEPILLPEHEGRASHDIMDERVVRKRNYRDSSFAILAALWLEYRGPGQNPQPTAAVQKRASRYTDHEMNYDYRTRKHGAWKAKDDLKRKGLINEEGGGYAAMKLYSLTIEGAKACFHLFNEIYHPSKGPYELIQPRHGTVEQDGSFYPPSEAPVIHRVHREPVKLHSDSSSTNTGNRTAMERPSTYPIEETGEVLKTLRDVQKNKEIPYQNLGRFESPSYNRFSNFLLPHEQKNGFGESVELSLSPPDRDNSRLHTDESILSVKRKRMLKLDPPCERSIKKYISWGMSEQEAWILYEQGAEQQQFAPKVTSAPSSKPTSYNNDNYHVDSVPKISKFIGNHTSGDPVNETVPSAGKYLEILEYKRTQSTSRGMNILSNDDLEVNRTPLSSGNRLRHCSGLKRKNIDINENLQIKTSTDLIDLSCDDKEILQKERVEIKISSQDTVILDLTDDSQSLKNLHVSRNYHCDHVTVSPLQRSNRMLENSKLRKSTIITSSSNAMNTPHTIDLSEESIHDEITQSLTVSSISNSNLSIIHSDTCYVESKPGNSLVLSLLIDRGERKSSDQDEVPRRFCDSQMDFLKGLQGYVADLVAIGPGELTLPMGNYMLALVGNNQDMGSSPISCREMWIADVVIEKEPVDRIVLESSAIVGPHFRKERNLRNSMLKYAFFLIEGDLNSANELSPHIPPGFQDDYLEQKMDVIGNREELIGYICGIWSRNYGNRNVILLHTENTEDTSMMIAAVCTVFANRDDADNYCYSDFPLFSEFQKYWNERVCNSRQDYLAGELECEEISTHMVQRIERRFGETNSLEYVYSKLCHSDESRQFLLSDLSLSSSNLRGEIIARDNEYIKDYAVIIRESSKVASIYHPSVVFNNSWDEMGLSLHHDTIVYHNELLDNLTNSMEGYGDFVSHELIESSELSPIRIASASNETMLRTHIIPWGEIVKRRTVSCSTSKFPFCRQRSSSMFLAILEGIDVVEAIAFAVDEICKSSSLTNNLYDYQSDVKCVKSAWKRILAFFPKELMNRWSTEKKESRYPQFVLLLENLGNSLDQLKSEYANACLLSSPVTVKVSVTLGKGREEISMNVATVLNRKLRWMVNLFVILGIVEYGFQPFPCNSSVTAVEIFGTLVNEVHENFLLTFDL